MRRIKPSRVSSIRSPLESPVDGVSITCMLPSSILIRRRFMLAAADAPPEAVGAGPMLSMRPKPGRICVTAAATGTAGAAGAAAAPGGVTTVVEGGVGLEGGTTTMGAGCLLAQAASSATPTRDRGRIRNLLI